MEYPTKQGELVNKDTREFTQFLLGLSFPNLACCPKMTVKRLMAKISYNKLA